MVGIPHMPTIFPAIFFFCFDMKFAKSSDSTLISHIAFDIFHSNRQRALFPQ